MHKICQKREVGLFKFLVSCFALSGFLHANTALENTIEHVLTSMQHTRYEHKAFIDERSGVYHVDCSAFVGFLLQKVSPHAYNALKIDKGHTRPRAQNFYDFLAVLNEGEKKEGWQGIQRINALEKFDIIAWKYDPSLGKKDTGHVVIVYEKPIKEADGRYRVRVLDASKGTHANDSRAQKSEGGIGEGVMWFRVDEEGKPLGLYWSDRSKSMSRHQISMGRVLP